MSVKKHGIFVILFSAIFYLTQLGVCWSQDTSDESPSSEFFFRLKEDQTFSVELSYFSGQIEYVDNSNNKPTDVSRVHVNLLYASSPEFQFGIRGDAIHKEVTNNQVTKESFGDPEIFVLSQDGSSFASFGLTLHVAKATTKTARIGGNRFYFAFGNDYGDQDLSYGFNTQFDFYTDRRIYDPTETTYVRLAGNTGLKLSFFAEKKFSKLNLGSYLLLEYITEAKYRNPQAGELAKIYLYPAPELVLYGRLAANDRLHLIAGGAFTLAENINLAKFELPTTNEIKNKTRDWSAFVRLRLIF